MARLRPNYSLLFTSLRIAVEDTSRVKHDVPSRLDLFVVEARPYLLPINIDKADLYMTN